MFSHEWNGIGIAPERWGGWDYTPDDRSGVSIWGENKMGELLMRVRNSVATKKLFSVFQNRRLV